MSMFHKAAIEMGIKSSRPKFIRINGRMVRDTRGTEVELRSQVKGGRDPVKEFKGRLSFNAYHKWS